VREQLVALLRFLGPLTGGASAMHAFWRAPPIRRGCASPSLGEDA
jgi:hypothetical protein